MKIKNYGKGNIENINKIEKEFGIKLPNDYKEYLLNNNGVMIGEACFYLKELKQYILMGVFYGIGTENNTIDIIKINKEFEDDIMENTLLIGEDDGGGMILLIFDGSNDGIWYYDHSYFFKQSTDELNTYYICETFTEFMEILEKTKYVE
ncbi:MAG: SMI1/KNR4 family protein [Candidatus Accumulibacter sp.]|jgi:hypothetical protein|nr:SMI1/KNR4 family protein [Accumulibacter sp.]